MSEDTSLTERWITFIMFHQEINAKGDGLIIKGSHDLIAVYNGNYDSVMHKTRTAKLRGFGGARLIRYIRMFFH